MLIVPNDYYEDGTLIRWYEYDNQVWYMYYDVASLLQYDRNTLVRNEKYINNDETIIFEQEYEDLRGNVRVGEYKYINTVALFKLIDKHASISGNLRRHVIKIESGLGYMNKFDNNNHILKVNLGLLRQCINDNDGDYEKLRSVAKGVCDSPTIRSIEEGDSKKEELIQQIREEIYDFDDEIEEVQLSIRAQEEKKVNFKRSNSSCPSWLKDCVK